MSSFSGLSVALSGLQAQRRAMDVTGQNVANAQTVGYTRQRADLRALGPEGTFSLQGTPRVTGSGVEVTGISRLSDDFAAARLRAQTSSSSYLGTRSTVLSQVESRFNEPSDAGLSARLAGLWSSWSDVANHPEDLAARGVLLQQAQTVVSQIAAGHAGVVEQWAQVHDQAGALAEEVTSVAASVADLNASIRATVQVGGSANELSDARDALVLRLSELTGASARRGEEGTVDVFLGGVAVVRGSSSSVVSLSDTPTRLADVPVPDPSGVASPRLLWADGSAVTVDGGTMAGMLEAMASTLPQAAKGYDDVAVALATSVNVLHTNGRALDGTPAGDFFNPTTTGAANLAMAITDPAQVAAARADGGPRDGRLADDIAQLASAATGADQAWRELVVTTAVVAQSATQRASSAQVVLREAANAVASTTGVDVDEEMVNLVMFQRGYEGAARVLTAVDQALDTLINRTGLVGR